jgi:DNA segregation ATPase FtsK/SpoIIIE-like protein
MVTEIVETAGFVNIHVIIASQRPDASTVLRPRIRANLLARMAFTTADRKNSEVILDREGAEKLGKIAGRAILNDGGTDTIQVPFLDAVLCDRLLEPYRREVESYEQVQEGFISDSIVEQIQGVEPESDGLFDLLNQFQSNQCDKQGFAEDVLGWEDSTGTEGER